MPVLLLPSLTKIWRVAFDVAEKLIHLILRTFDIVGAVAKLSDYSKARLR